MVPDMPTYFRSWAFSMAMVPIPVDSLWSVTATPVTWPFRSTPTTMVMGPLKPWVWTSTQYPSSSFSRYPAVMLRAFGAR